jgi:hypothetical protein
MKKWILAAERLEVEISEAQEASSWGAQRNQSVHGRKQGQVFKFGGKGGRG